MIIPEKQMQQILLAAIGGIALGIIIAPKKFTTVNHFSISDINEVESKRPIVIVKPEANAKKKPKR